MKYKVLNVVTNKVEELEGPFPVYSAYLVCPPGVVEMSDASDTQTEQGYIPPEVQIRDQLRAGLMQDAAKRARFDSDLYPEGTLDMEIALDPYREMGADVVDLARQATLVGSRLRQQDSEAKKAAEAAEEARRAKAVSELSSQLVGKSAQEIDGLLKSAKIAG